MTSQHKPFFLLSLALLSILPMVDSDAILTLLQEQSSVYNTIAIKFNETMFAQFYTCICGQHRHECSVQYRYFNQFQPFGFAIQPKNVDSNHQSFSNYYQCNHSATRQDVKCRRLRVEDMTCKQTNNFTIIPIPSTTLCDLTCVGLVWFNPGRESLVYNSIKQSKTKCSVCSQSPATKTTESTTRASLLPIAPLSTRSTSVSRESMDNSKKDNGTDDNNSIPVIMGVVIGVLSIILLAIAIIFVVWRRKKRNLRESRQNSTTCTIVSDRRNASKLDAYETVGIEPTTSNTVSISDNTRTIPDFDLTTVLPSDDTNNRETVSTYVNQPHNGDIKHDQILDNFGYSTIDIGEKASAGEAHPSYENFPDTKSDQHSREMTNATGYDFPEHTDVSTGHQNQQYYNFLSKEDGNEGIPSASFSPDSHLPEFTAVNKPDKSSLEYVNSLTKAK